MLEKDPEIVSIDARALLRGTLVTLVGVELLLVYLDLVFTLYEAAGTGPLVDLCNLVAEGSLGGWFSSALALAVAFTALLVHVRERGVGWAVVAGFFGYLALDDGAAVHEALGSSIAQAWPSLRAFPSYAWQVVFGPPIALLAAFTAGWTLRRVRRRRLRILAVAGLALLAIAVGLDFVEGLEDPYVWATARFALHEDTVPHLSGVLEEWLEMLGVTLFLGAALGHLLDRCAAVVLRVDPGFEAAP
jgi:hypothetical protein